MVDRSVEVKLRLDISNFNSSATSARATTAGLAAEMKAADAATTGTRNALGQFVKGGTAPAAQSVRSLRTNLMAMDAQGQKTRAGLTQLGGTAGKVGVVAAAALGAVVLSAAKFDKAMSNVAATGPEAAAGLDALRAAAIKAGADTAFSAGEAAQGVEELLKAGVSVSDVLGGGLAGALNLAAAGEMEVGDAAELAATAMTQFNLSGSDVNHVADLLAAGAGKAQGSVADLGMALKQSGLVAAQTGLSIEETTGTLTAFASAGLLGSDAGTSFKTFLQSLTPTSTKAAHAMSEMGFSAYDAQGKFKGMTDVAGQLRAGLSTMSDEQQNATLKTIFGSDAVRAASVIYQQGASGIQGWIDKTNDAGYAADTAATRLDNLAGDFEALKGSLETALIGAGEGSQGPLRQMVQGITAAVNAFNTLPPAAQGATTGLLAVTAITGGSLWFGAKTISGINSTRIALSELGIAGKITASSLAKFAAGGIAFAALSIAVVDLMNDNQALKQSFSDLQGSLNNMDLSTAKQQLADLAAGQADYAAARDVAWYDVPSPKNILPAITNSFSGLFGQDDTGERQTEIDNQTESTRLLQESLAELGKTLGINMGPLDGSARSLAALNAVGVKARPIMDAASVSSQALADAMRVFDETGDRGLLDVYLKQIADAAPKAAKGEHEYTTAAERAKGATEEQTKALAAQDAAFAKVREAAATTAGSFLDFSRSTDAAKTSLGGFIQQMHDNAVALEQFTQNSVKAAEKGVSQGLISQLRQLGPEGAKQLKWLADATDKEIRRANAAYNRGRRAAENYADTVTGVPELNMRVQDAEGRARIKRIQELLDKFGMTKAEATAFLRDAASDKTKAVQRLIDKYGISKGEATALLRDLASGAIARVRAELAGLNGNSADTYIYTHHVSLTEGRQVDPGLGKTDPTSAGGSTVPGPRTQYRDMVQYLVAPGEEIVSNGSGQADRNRPLLKAINAGQDPAAFLRSTGVSRDYIAPRSSPTAVGSGRGGRMVVDLGVIRIAGTLESQFGPVHVAGIAREVAQAEIDADRRFDRTHGVMA